MYWVMFMPFFLSKRKVQKFGTSLAITLPALFVKGNEIKKGCEAMTFFSFEGILIASWLDDYEEIKRTLVNMMAELERRNNID